MKFFNNEHNEKENDLLSVFFDLIESTTSAELLEEVRKLLPPDKPEDYYHGIVHGLGKLTELMIKAGMYKNPVIDSLVGYISYSALRRQLENNELDRILEETEFTIVN